MSPAVPLLAFEIWISMPCWFCKYPASCLFPLLFSLRILCLMLCPFTPRLNLFSTGYSSDNLQTPHAFFFLHTLTIQPPSRISTTSCHHHLPPLFLTPHSSKPLTVNQQQYLIATSSTLHPQPPNNHHAFHLSSPCLPPNLSSSTPKKPLNCL